jgi:hypothetical protein
MLPAGRPRGWCQVVAAAGGFDRARPRELRCRERTALCLRGPGRNGRLRPLALDVAPAALLEVIEPGVGMAIFGFYGDRPRWR